MSKKKTTALSVYDFEGEMIDVIIQLQEVLTKLQQEGYHSNIIKYVPETRLECETYIIESERD